MMPESLVVSDDAGQVVGQIILTATSAVHLDRRAHVRRGDWQDREHHPVWASVSRIQAQHTTVFVADVLQDVIHTSATQYLLAQLH
jgi:hypothetical protein